MGDQVKGVHGLKVLGGRDLYYRLTFLACSISVISFKISQHLFTIVADNCYKTMIIPQMGQYLFE